MENTSTVSSYLGEKEIQELLTSKSLIIRPLLDNSQINGISIDFRLGTDFLVSIQGREAFINASLNYENQVLLILFSGNKKKSRRNVFAASKSNGSCFKPRIHKTTTRHICSIKYA